MSSKEKLRKDKKEDQSEDKKEGQKEDKKEKKKEDSLFLIEALVDKIIFPPNPDLPELPEKDFRTCVSVECTNVEPIEICDDDPGGVEHKSGGGLIKVFNCGKSCLFSLNDGDIKAAMSKFAVNISVYKALPCGCMPAKLIIGEAEIDLTKEFVEARNTFLKDPSCVSSQALKDTFIINDQDGNLKAQIVMFLRISCFGKLIVTRFQGGAPSLSMGQKSSAEICHTKENDSQSNLPCTAGSGQRHSVCPPASDPYGRMICQDPEDPCYCTGPHQPPREPVACRNTDPYCLHVPKGRSKLFEEIGTNMGGNELRIKVPAKCAIIKKVSPSSCTMQSPYTKGRKYGPGECDRPCGRNQISLGFPSEDVCCKGARLAGTQFTCTTEGCSNSKEHGLQGEYNRGDANKELPNNDVYVLKIAKTAYERDKKCKMELELVTPKAGDKRPPIRKANTCIQSDLDCECCVRRLKKPKPECPPIY